MLDTRGIVVRDGLADEKGRINSDLLGAVGRMAGHDYYRTRDRFTIPNGFPPGKKPNK